jgi:integrase
MAVEITADGAFPELFSEYIDYKRNLGYLYPDSRLYLVRRLSRFLAERAADERVLTRNAAEAFARHREGESSGSTAGRQGIARQFALFLRWKGIDAWVLPERSQPRQSRSFVPRIVTADEIARVIACADARPASRCGPQTQPVYAMLVRLLWCCGLRIGEALSLRTGDVDLVDAVITVRKAKHNRTRLVPMSESLAAHARCYATIVGLVPEDPGAWFFPSPRGGGYNPGSATAHIQGLMLQAGVITASGRAPRAHDLRHYADGCVMRPVDAFPLLGGLRVGISSA